MRGSKRDEMDTLLRAYSIISEREDAWLSQVIMRNAEADNVQLGPDKVQTLTERFSAEKPFGETVSEAISKKNLTTGQVSSAVGISAEIFEKVLANAALPNIVPLRKMIALLRYLTLPLDLAIGGMRASFDRFQMEDASDWTPSPAMRRGKHMPSRSGRTEERSREVLRRGIEAYIKRLAEEGD